jgi:putative N6-adenine-specific DNA methylase
MQVFNSPSRIIVTCHKWMAPYLEQEIRAMGFRTLRTFQTGVELRGAVNDCIRLNLNLRCASQVMYSLKEFYCDSPEQLYQSALTIPWELILNPDIYLSVTSNVFHPSIRTNLFANLKVKDAIADRLREKTGKRPESGPDLNGAVVYLFWKNKKAELFLDTSGETLAKHGYRKLPGRAPMLEALASSVIFATRWDRRSPFVNPMCGSGTLAIEAALIATSRRPGLLRDNYAFMHIDGYREGIFLREQKLLEQHVRDVSDLKIIATDISEEAVKIAKVNAKAAGVEQYLEFEVCDFEKTKVPEKRKGVVVFNPEYGERLGNEKELESTYARIGDFLKQQCEGYLGYVFTGNLELAKVIGLRTKRRIEFFTAKIDCRLLEYELYEGSLRNED